jgi:predicted enzyme related to lactoylglutathione lyase
VVVGWFPDLCVADVAASRAFYVALVDLAVLVDHRWYVELGVGDRVALALVERGHDTLPGQAGGPPTGLLVSFEVDDVDDVATRATALHAPVVWPLTTELGQRHLMVADPDGTMVDVIQRVALRASDRRRLAGYRRRADGGG